MARFLKFVFLIIIGSGRVLQIDNNKLANSLNFEMKVHSRIAGEYNQSKLVG